MPARDTIHDAVVAALLKDGWVITDDPLVYRYGRRLIYIDLAAESEEGLLKLMREGERIAVEIKSFPGPSDLVSLEHAVGQYVIYNLVLKRSTPHELCISRSPGPRLTSSLASRWRDWSWSVCR